MGKTPTTKTEMKILLDDLFKVWQKYPYFRFGQLVVNLFGTDPFYIEDKRVIEIINKVNQEGLSARNCSTN